jgi:hypothetical protein
MALVQKYGLVHQLLYGIISSAKDTVLVSYPIWELTLPVMVHYYHTKL